MEDFAVPGTWGSLALRLFQCIFAALSIRAMETSAHYYCYTALSCLVTSMALQGTWGFLLALLDAYLLFQKDTLYDSFPVYIIALGDWANAALSLGSVAASVGIMEKLRDVEDCNNENECYIYQVSIGFAFFSWITLAFSSLFILSLLARLSVIHF